MGVEKMPLIQLDLSEKANDKLEHYMIDKHIKNKRSAVLSALESFFNIYGGKK